jgi:alpha-soluble NSF attachment protein
LLPNSLSPHQFHASLSHSVINVSNIVYINLNALCPPNQAVDIYESVANQSIESPLLKYAAKEHYFRAALCHLCIDQLNAQLAVKKYEEMYPQFSDSRECKLLKQLLERLEENDVDGYTAAIQEYDSISRLDQWYTNILLQIKKQIESDSDMK